MLSARTMNFDGPAVVMGAKAHDVDLSHSGAQISQKPRGEQEEGSMDKELLVNGHHYGS